MRTLALTLFLVAALVAAPVPREWRRPPSIVGTWRFADGDSYSQIVFAADGTWWQEWPTQRRPTPPRPWRYEAGDRLVMEDAPLRYTVSHDTLTIFGDAGGDWQGIRVR